MQFGARGRRGGHGVSLSSYLGMTSSVLNIDLKIPPTGCLPADC